MTYYTRDIEMPKTKLDGLKNFIQMAINAIEAGDDRNALLLLVDLRDDLSSNSNPYNEIFADDKTTNKAVSAAVTAANLKHQANIIAAHNEGRNEGIAEEKARVAKMLGLAS